MQERRRWGWMSLAVVAAGAVVAASSGAACGSSDASASSASDEGGVGGASASASETHSASTGMGTAGGGGACPTLCGGACVDETSDANNCGGCGKVCPPGASCASKECACPSGQAVCAGACMDVSSDPNNCGACGRQCTTGIACLGGDCGVSAVSAGYFHACALTKAGGIECWGQGTHGELGDGTRTDSPTPVAVQARGTLFTAVASGNGFACGLTTAGGVQCWGYDLNGELGDGMSGNGMLSTTPVDVTGLTSGVTAISAGDAFACAVKSSGRLVCWGANPWGQLGDGTMSGRTSPVAVTGGIASVSAGFDATCAWTAVDGAKCWGEGTFGQLGTGATNDSTTPVDVAGLTLGVAGVSAGNNFACALMGTGGVKCWGTNPGAGLGDGTMNSSTTPVDVVGLPSVTAVSAGFDSMCALTTAGGLKCWGGGTALGDGSFTLSLTPVDVVGLTSGVQQVSVGGEFACAVTTAGGVDCWGHGDEGELGDGAMTTSATPVAVAF